MTNSIKEAIQYVDSKTIFKEYVKRKFKYQADFADVVARDLFNSTIVTVLVIKYAYSYNYYRIRKAMINGKSTGTECIRYNESKTLEHAVKCWKVRSLQHEFRKKIAQDLFCINGHRVHEEIILNILEDILIFFDSGEEEEFETSQQYIGIREIFIGFIVKNWEGASFNCEKFRDLNKVLIVNAVLFYKQCWTYRNEYYFNKEKRKRVVQ